jgi:4-hydroxy-tetrahydrodipicolinate synthase
MDLGAMWDLIDFLSDQRVNGIVLLGSTGEFVHYTNDERMRMTGLAPKRSRVPVLVNVSHSTLDGAVELAQAAAASGAASVLLMAPYYFRYTQESIRFFYLRFAEDTELSIPVLIYDLPALANPIEPATMEALLNEGVVQGVNDSTGDWDEFLRLREMQQRKSFTLMMGSDRLVARARANGSSGSISDVACAAPELMLGLERAICSGSQEVVTRLEARLQQFLDWTDRLPQPVVIREAASIRGFKMGPHAIPLSPAQEQSAAGFREWFKTWLSVVQKECKYA